jgi:competence ComEA-like helix-hairpin-helix protein
MLKSDKQVVDAPLDLNRAGVKELASIDGIGMARANAIVDWRERNGFFEAVEDLQHVSDITPEAVQKFRPFLKVLDEDFPMGRNKDQAKPEPIGNPSRAGGKPEGAKKAPEHQPKEHDAERREFGRDG